MVALSQKLWQWPATAASNVTWDSAADSSATAPTWTGWSGNYWRRIDQWWANNSATITNSAVTTATVATDSTVAAWANQLADAYTREEFKLWVNPIYETQFNAWVQQRDQELFTRWAAIQHETAEQRAARQAAEAERRRVWEAEQAERNARYAAQQLEREKANTRAEIILREHLSPAQLDELARNGHFHLESIAPNGQRKRYRIERGTHGNIYEVNAAGQKLRRLCVQPIGQMPIPDVMLAQKLWLEHNEPELVRTANVTQLRAAGQ